MIVFQNCGKIASIENLASEASFAKLNNKLSTFADTTPLSFGGNGHNTSWDGRLIIYTTGQGWEISVMRPELVQSQQGLSVNFGSIGSGAMSATILALTPTVENDGSNNFVVSKDSMDKTSFLFEFNALTFAPASGNPTHNNPYKSNLDGAETINGQYECYDLFIYTQLYGGNPPAGHSVKSALSNLTRQYGNRILGRLQLKVIIENPKTPSARPIKTILVEDFKPLMTIRNTVQRGLEPSITTDGKLLIFNDNGIYSGVDSLMYIYTTDPTNTNNWSTPKPISSLYYEDSNFKAQYPIARLPLRSNLGDIYNEGEYFVGAYPWISWEGSEITFMALQHNSIARPHARARRAGFSIIGRWTGNKVRHIDGSFNSKDTIGTRDTNSDKTVRLFTSAIGSTSSIWNPFNSQLKPALPYLYQSPSLFIISSNTAEFSEVGFQDFTDGRYILSLPMNPAIRKLTPGAWPITNEVDFNKTPDLSMNNLNGTISGNASFPLVSNSINFGTNSVQIQDTQTSIGAKGQGIRFPATGAVTVSSSDKFKESDSGLTVELFVKPILNTRDHHQFLIHKRDSYSIILEPDSRVTIRAFVNNQEHMLHFIGPSIPTGEWTHLAFTHNPKTGNIQAFFNARLMAEKTFSPGHINHTDTRLLIGPAGQTTQSSEPILIIDEVKISSTIRSSVELANSAGIPYNQRMISTSRLNIPSIYSLTDFRFPVEIRLSQQKSQLGAMLFKDVRLSSNGQVSCSSCHLLSHRLADNLASSRGVTGHPLIRNAPPVFNRLLGPLQNWDGKFNSLKDQAEGPLTHVDEMGLRDMEQAAEIIKNIPGYHRLFSDAFGINSINSDNIKTALASFQASIMAQNSPADLFHLGNSSSLNASQLRGRNLFFGKARCVACHSGVNYSDEQFHNTGLLMTLSSDKGRESITGRSVDLRSFKTPTLRNIAHTAPYMHNGSVKTLKEVVDLYNSGGVADQLRDAEIKPLGLTSDEVNELVSFLNSLSSDLVSILPINLNPNLPASCLNDEIASDDRCIKKPKLCQPLQTMTCPIVNGTGQKSCSSDGFSWNSCNIISCNNGFLLNNNQCIVDPLEVHRNTVRLLYREILKREADPEGLRTYTNLLVSGQSVDQVRTSLRNSDEGLCKNTNGQWINGQCQCTSPSELKNRKCQTLTIKYLPGEFLLRQNQSAALENIIIYMQNDGNVVIYNKITMTPLWSINKTGLRCDTTTPCQLIFQTDGNLVAYHQANQIWNVIWAANTVGGKQLIYNNQKPYLTIIDQSNRTLWSSGQ